MTIGAFLIGVARKFVPESRRRISFAPRSDGDFIEFAHRRRDFRIEIGFRHFRRELVTGRAVGRRGRESRLLRMTRKTSGVPGRNGFESSFFQPESIAQFRGRLGQIFIVGFSLRLIRLVTNRAAFFARRFSFRRERCIDERAVAYSLNVVLRHDFDVFVVRKRNGEIRRVPLSFGGFVENLARIRERMARAVAGSRIRVANRADRRFGAAEKLLPMTIQTGFVFRIIGHVRKRIGFRSHALPVCRRKFVARSAAELAVLARRVRKFGEFRVRLNFRYLVEFGRHFNCERARIEGF